MMRLSQYPSAVLADEDTVLTAEQEAVLCSGNQALFRRQLERFAFADLASLNPLVNSNTAASNVQNGLANAG